MTHASRRSTPMPERIEALPRRLVGRRRVGGAPQIIKATDSSQFNVGDMINHAEEDGEHLWMTILGIDADGSVEAAYWNGMPQFFATTIDALDDLRVIAVEKMCADDVNMYRNMLNLEPRTFH